MHKIVNNIKLSILFVLFLFFFVSFKHIQYPLVCLIFVSLFTIRYGVIKLKVFKHALPILSLFTINLISLLYSNNLSEGWSTVETQLSLLLLSLLIIFDSEFYFKNKQKIINIFVIASFLGIVVYTILFIQSGNLPKLIDASKRVNLFSLIRWYNISNFQHPSYISLSFLFSVLLIISLFSRKDKYYMLILKLTGVFVVLLFIFVLNSRASLLSIFFVFIYYTIKFLRDYKRIYTYFSLILLLTVFSYLLINSRFNNNIKRIRQGVSIENIEEIDIRISLWKNALIVWKEKPIFGYGIGDAKDSLAEVHKKRNITDAIKQNLNSHNQFLETAIQTGIVGLTVLLLVFAIPLYQSIKKKQELLFMFLMISFINFMFESMLQRLAGVSFFAFWYSFLWFVYYKNIKEPAESIVNTKNQITIKV